MFLDVDEFFSTAKPHARLILEKDAEDFEAKLEKKFDEYVLRLVFESYKEHLDSRLKPIERLVYGMVGLILISVMTAIIATVVVG